MGGAVGGGVMVERVPLDRLKPAEWNPNEHGTIGETCSGWRCGIAGSVLGQGVVFGRLLGVAGSDSIVGIRSIPGRFMGA